jgi:hypothetical protein
MRRMTAGLELVDHMVVTAADLLIDGGFAA